MSFFDTTPTGRILSRFSKDVSEIDQAIPGMMDLFLITFIGFLVSMGTILYSAYFFAVVLPLLIFIYYNIVQYYRPVARDAKRLEAISRSPVYAFFSEAICKLTEDMEDQNRILIPVHFIRRWPPDHSCIQQSGAVPKDKCDQG